MMSPLFLLIIFIPGILACPDGTAPINGECVACPDHCLICLDDKKVDDEAGTCYKCEDGYYPAGSGRGCNAIPFAHCMEMNVQRFICNRCEGIYAPVGGICEPKCEPECTECYVDDEGNGVCHACINNLTPPNCIPCDVDDCILCDPDRIGDCLQCNPGFFPNSGIAACHECIENCDDCSKDPFTCTICSSGFSLNARDYCDECQVEGCLECVAGTTDKCAICEDGRFPRLHGECPDCTDAHCTHCPVLHQCQECIEGYRLNPHTGTCEVMDDQHCIDWDDDLNCIECVERWILNSENICVYEHCSENGYSGTGVCLKCDENTFANVPIAQFYIGDYVPTRCTETCPDPYYTLTLDSNSLCITHTDDENRCPESYLPNADKRHCFNCMDNCERCETQDTCDLCANDYYPSIMSNKFEEDLGYPFGHCISYEDCKASISLHDETTVCLADGYCPDGYSNAGEGIHCIQCEDANCKECTSADTCIECQDGYWLDESNQCSPCPEGCNACLDDSRCFECADGYLVERTKEEYLENPDFIPDEDEITECIAISRCRYKLSPFCLTNGCPLEGFYEERETSSCKPCIENCEVCEGENECDICIPGYLKLVSHDYNPYEYPMPPAPYSGCIDPYECRYTLTDFEGQLYCFGDECPEEYFYDHGDACYQCIDNCQKCETGLLCKFCVEGYLPLITAWDYIFHQLISYDGCVTEESCAIKIDGEKEGVPVEFCLEDRCPDSYYLDNNNKCQPCLENCESCSGPNECDVCERNLYPLTTLNNLSHLIAGEEIGFSGCVKYADCPRKFEYTIDGDDTVYDICLSDQCPQKHFENAGYCRECTSGCKSCSNLLKCDECEEGLLMGVPTSRIQEDGSIEGPYLKCVDQTLCNYIYQEEYCLTNNACPVAYYHLGQLCLPCSAHCLDCPDEDRCLTCEDGWAKISYSQLYPNLEDYFCFGCMSYERCYYKYTHNGIPYCFQDGCPDEHYADPEEGCIHCPENCLSCSEGGECDECAIGYMSTYLAHDWNSGIKKIFSCTEESDCKYKLGDICFSDDCPDKYSHTPGADTCDREGMTLITVGSIGAGVLLVGLIAAMLIILL